MSTTVTRGPAQIEFGGLKFITAEPVTVTLNPESFDIKTDSHGKIDERMKARTATVAFTPSGQWLGEAITLLAAASARVPGTSILTGPLVIKPLISPQQVFTIARAGLSAAPDLLLSASKTLFGSLTFMGLAAADSETGAILVPSAYSAPTSTFTPEGVITEPWIGNYGVPDEEGAFNPDADVTLLNIETEDGWTLRTDISTDMVRADSAGIVDIVQTDCSVSASCKPVGVAEEDLLTFLERSAGSDVALRPGMPFAYEAGAGLYLTSRSGYKVNLLNAGARSGSMAWGSTRNRTDGLTFNGRRKFSAGALQAMLAFTAP